MNCMEQYEELSSSLAMRLNQCELRDNERATERQAHCDLKQSEPLSELTPRDLSSSLARRVEYHALREHECVQALRDTESECERLVTLASRQEEILHARNSELSELNYEYWRIVKQSLTVRRELAEHSGWGMSETSEQHNGRTLP